MCEPSRKKQWNDVTVTAWIPAQLCSKLDLFALRLKIDRRQALELVLLSVLPEAGFLRELEMTTREEECGVTSCQYCASSSGLRL